MSTTSIAEVIDLVGILTALTLGAFGPADRLPRTRCSCPAIAAYH
jgi:hypothetical protein